MYKMGKRPKRGIKQYWVNISISAVTFLLLGILIEVIAGRVIAKNNDHYPVRPTHFHDAHDKMHVFNKTLGWVLNPGYDDGYIRINDEGFRSTFNYSQAVAQHDRKKIFVIGDSMVFGATEEQDSIFTELLNKNQDELFFFNGGTSGYSTVQEYLLLQQRIDQFQPDLVVLFYTQANDMWWNGRPGTWNPYITKNGPSFTIHEAEKVIQLPAYTRLNSYRILNRHLLHGKDFTYVKQKIDFALRKDKSTVWQITAHSLNLVAEICGKRGIDFMIIDIPTMNQLKEREKEHPRQLVLNEFCQKEDYDYYNLLDLYPSNYLTLFNPNDSHWSGSGHRFISEFLYEKITGARLQFEPLLSEPSENPTM